MRLRRKVSVGAILALSSAIAFGQQASITLRNSDVQFCYKQDASWTLTKTNDSNYPASVNAGDTVNWTITATRGVAGPKVLCAIGYVSVTNTGSAPASIGNIVVDLQRRDGNNWKAISADVADATNGDGATSAKIVAAALANQTLYTGVASVPVGSAAAIFSENTISGALSFTDADSNTIWNITPQQSIGVGQTVNLFFTAVFQADNISPALVAAEQLRTEVFVTFGNAGARGGSGSTASNIDINGNGSVDADEANVRTVPTRVTKNLPTLQVCNDEVTITDEFSTGDATVNLTTDPIGSGVTTKTSQVYTLTGTVGGSGTLANTAKLKGSDSSVTLNLGPDSVTGLPILKDVLCCTALDLSANSNVAVVEPVTAQYCSYTQGAFNDRARGVPSQLLVSNFATYFPAPNGLLIGINPQYYAKWTDLSKLRQWLGGGGPSGALTANTTNATSTSGGALAKQTAALTINVVMGAVYPYGGIGSLIYQNPGDAFNGKTVAQILAAANTALGTGALPSSGYTFGTLNTLITNLNQSWDNCIQSSWAVTYLK